MGGSLCGWLGRQILEMLPIKAGVLWMVLYFILVTLLWPVCVLIISILTGQYRFFTRYLKRIFKRFSGRKTTTQARVAIFASGTGTNAKKIIEFFDNQDNNSIATINLIITNNPNAEVIKLAENKGIPVVIVQRERFIQGDGYLPELLKWEIQYVILAGFLWKIPQGILAAFRGRILNIHPALLPKFGGKGMYGHFVHEAVIASGEQKSGITIHEVNEHYDEGNPVFQAQCEIDAGETPQSLAKKIQQLEHQHYPRVIKAFITKPKRG